MTYHVTMDKKDIMFFCAIVEATERYCFVRTIDSKTPVIEINVAPDYKKEAKELLDLISRTINFKILDVIEND